MNNLKLICPDCSGTLITDNNKLHCINNHSFFIENGIFNLLPHPINDLTKGDASYHESQKEGWVELNQINALRCLFFHKKIVEFISQMSSKESSILEIGSGVGFDLELLLADKPSFKNYVFSEISEEILSYVSKKINNNTITYFCIDGDNIPFEKEQFDILYMVAALHHFSDTSRALEEIIRVTKKNGLIILGIEPNKHLFFIISKIGKNLSKILPGKKHSPADENMEGFSAECFKKIEKDYNLYLLKLEPVWFFCGFIHYGLEFLYRLLRLKKRIRLPFFFERLMLYLDRFIFYIPVMREFCWHYTVIYQKK